MELHILNLMNSVSESILTYICIKGDINLSILVQFILSLLKVSDDFSFICQMSKPTLL